MSVWSPGMECVTRKHSNHEKVLHPSHVESKPDTYIEAIRHAPARALTAGFAGLIRLDFHLRLGLCSGNRQPDRFSSRIHD
jgi:hypothetical protein